MAEVLRLGTAALRLCPELQERWRCQDVPAAADGNGGARARFPDAASGGMRWIQSNKADLTAGRSPLRLRYSPITTALVSV